MTLLTIDDLSFLLKISRKTIYYWVSRNEVPFIRVGKHLRFDQDEVERFFREKTEQSKPACFASKYPLNRWSPGSLKTRNAGHSKVAGEE